MSKTRREKERTQKLWAERRALLRFGYGKLAESIVRQAHRHYQQALQAWQKGDLAEAEKQLRHALDLVPDAPDPLLALGRLLVETQRAEAAVGYLSRASEVDGENPEAHFWFGQALEATGRLRRAKEAYERALQRQPSPELAQRLQERLRQLTARLSEQKASTLPDEQAKALEEALHWAQFYLDIGFPRRAREYVEQARQIAPDHPQVRAVAIAVEQSLATPPTPSAATERQQDRG